MQRERETCFTQHYVRERDRYDSGVLESAGTIFERDNVTLEWYCKEIILEHLRLFRDEVKPDFLFMEDIVLTYKNTQVQNISENEIIN